MKDVTYEVESIYNDFDNNLIKVPNDFTIASKSGRFTGSGSKHNGIYRLSYPVTGNDKIDDLLRMHEYGHVYLGHFEGIHEELDRSLMRIIRNKDSQLIKAVNEKCNIDYADKILDKVISDPTLNHFIHSISMDMEVNSTVLDKDDLNTITSEVNKMIYEEYMRISDNGKKMPSDKALDNLHSKFDIKFIHPSDFGFPEGLTYPDYIVLSVLNLDKVLNTLSNSMNNGGRAERNRQNQQNQDQQESDGSGGSGERSQARDANDNSSMPKTMEEFEDMMRNQSESSNQSDGDNGGSSDSQNDQQNSNSGSEKSDNEDQSGNESNSNGGSSDDESEDDQDPNEDHGTDSRDEADDKRENDLGNYYSSGGNGAGGDTSDSVRNYNVNNDPLTIALEEVIRNYRHKVIKRDFTKDMTHKYNRRILGRNNKMLSPTYRQKITKTEEPTILFAVDVSGSMDTDVVDRIVTTIRNEMKRINRSLKYNLVAWDTRMQQYYRDITSDTPIPKLSCCGGTRMGGVFDLFKKDYGMDSILILISDFGDEDLNEWHQKEMNMNGYTMYGFKYGNDSYYSSRMPDFKNFKVRECG